MAELDRYVPNSVYLQSTIYLPIFFVTYRWFPTAFTLDLVLHPFTTHYDGIYTWYLRLPLILTLFTLDLMLHPFTTHSGGIHALYLFTIDSCCIYRWFWLYLPLISYCIHLPPISTTFTHNLTHCIHLPLILVVFTALTCCIHLQLILVAFTTYSDCIFPFMSCCIHLPPILFPFTNNLHHCIHLPSILVAFTTNAVRLYPLSCLSIYHPFCLHLPMIKNYQRWRWTVCLLHCHNHGQKSWFKRIPKQRTTNK